MKQYNILAISGGGKYGAYSAGVLGGWTESGTRPVFDVVTGVSTGSIVAVYAYLGSDYDELLKHFYTTVRSRDVYRRKPILLALTGSSFASSEPLRRLIDRAVTPELVTALAATHAQGRRLLIGTTNLDTKRLSVWDIGAIASSDAPDRRALISKIILAATSVPGQFPPVEFEIEVNGKKYTELHADGGVSSEVFLRLSHLNIPPEQLESGPRPLAGSNVYAIISGRIYPTPKCIQPSLFGVLGNSVSSLITAMTQNDLIRIYTLSLLTGMKFHYTALRQNYEDDGRALGFDPAEQVKLYEEGRQVGLMGTMGPGWKSEPPSVLRSEHAIPRTGVTFTGRGLR